MSITNYSTKWSQKFCTARLSVNSFGVLTLSWLALGSTCSELFKILWLDCPAIMIKWLHGTKRVKNKNKIFSSKNCLRRPCVKLIEMKLAVFCFRFFQAVKFSRLISTAFFLIHFLSFFIFTYLFKWSKPFCK